MADYRLMADTWMRIDPDTVDSPRPRIRRLVKGDIVPGITDEEIEYLTGGARPMLVEADSDADPFKDDGNAKHVAGNSAPKDNPSVDTKSSAPKDK
jgi:hypothetical protein